MVAGVWGVGGEGEGGKYGIEVTADLFFLSFFLDPFFLNE